MKKKIIISVLILLLFAISCFAPLIYKKLSLDNQVSNTLKQEDANVTPTEKENLNIEIQDSINDKEITSNDSIKENNNNNDETKETTSSTSESKTETKTNNTDVNKKTQTQTKTETKKKTETKTTTETKKVESKKQTNTNTKKSTTAWEKLGISEYDYYNKPMWSWARIDFSVKKYGSYNATHQARIDAGHQLKDILSFTCTNINSYSGDYLGDMLSVKK